MSDNVIDDDYEPFQKSEPIPAEKRAIISITEAISWMMFKNFEELTKCYEPSYSNHKMTLKEFENKEPEAARLIVDAAIEDKIILWGKQEAVLPKVLKQIPTEILMQGLCFFNPLNNELVFGGFSNSYAWQCIEIKKAKFIKWWNEEPTNPANNPNHNANKELAAITRWKSAFDKVQELMNGEPTITQEEAIRKLFTEKHSSVQRIKTLRSYKSAYFQAIEKYRFNNL